MAKTEHNTASSRLQFVPWWVFPMFRLRLHMGLNTIAPLRGLRFAIPSYAIADWHWRGGRFEKRPYFLFGRWKYTKKAGRS